MKSKAGRKPKYNPERVAKICKALEQGESEANAAKMAGIAPQTLCEWKAQKPEFKDAVEKAQKVFEEWQLNGILDDARKSLKTLICGQEYEEIKTEYEQDPKRPGEPRIKKQTRVTKKVLPNATAVIFALCNRDPEHWQNRVAQEVSGKLNVENEGNGVSLANVPDSLLSQVIEAIRGE